MNERTKAFLDRLLNEGIKPHVEKIATIHAVGDVAIVFFDVETADDNARSFGWTGGRSECTSMNRTRAAKFADAIAKIAPTDPAVGWLRSRKTGRIFVFIHSGTLCVNFAPDSGFSFEPGTMDREWMS